LSHRVKTTIEISDELFRDAKAAAAREGLPLKKFVAEALRDKLAARKQSGADKPWMKHFGALSHLSRAEDEAINSQIEAFRERIDEEKW
jgi:hypothetical protein